MSSKKLFAAESATRGQPDKLCDLIADTILDHVLSKDRFARVDMDAMVTSGLVFLAGQISTKAYVNLKDIVHQVVADAGYRECETHFESGSIAVLHAIGEQSSEVALAVDNKGAGNQCVCVGYASDEGRELGVDLDAMPLPQWLAHRLTRRLDELRDAGELNDFYPDGTSQVVVQYENGVPTRVLSVTLNAHHKSAADLDHLRRELVDSVMDPILSELPPPLVEKTERWANRAGPFTIGGPAADVGLSGRKGAGDAYGTSCAFGGSSPIGKDPTKTDRAGLYMARYLAKNIVAARLAKNVEIRLVYLFGRRDPVSVQVDCLGTGQVGEAAIAQALREQVDLSSPGIVELFSLRDVRYAPVSCGGCFGRPELNLPWERIDLGEILEKSLSREKS